MPRNEIYRRQRDYYTNQTVLIEEHFDCCLPKTLLWEECLNEWTVEEYMNTIYSSSVMYINHNAKARKSNQKCTWMGRAFTWEEEQTSVPKLTLTSSFMTLYNASELLLMCLWEMCKYTLSFHITEKVWQRPFESSTDSNNSVFGCLRETSVTEVWFLNTSDQQAILRRSWGMIPSHMRCFEGVN